MEQIILDLVSFINSHEVPDSFSEVESKLGRRNLRLVTIKLLSWIKSQYNSGRCSPLKLNLKYPWCRNLSYWYELEPSINKVFSIRESAYFDFSDTIQDDKKQLIRSYVGEHFNPIFFT